MAVTNDLYPVGAMSDPVSPRPPFDRGFEIHGVRIGVGATDADLLDRLIGLLPPGTKTCDPATVDRRFALWDEGGAWRCDSGTGPSPIMSNLSLAIGVLDTQMRLYIAHTSPERIFVHAGVVAHHGRAIVAPGETLSGKSTLVAALVRAGALYYSDEYAILDRQGLVHPYARPVSIRDAEGLSSTRLPIASFGGTAGEGSVPVGLIAVTRYRPEATWSPERRSAGEGMLALLAHAVPAHDRPAEVPAATKGAASTALVLEGDRGEADVTARDLLEAVASLANGARAGTGG
jgi:hypothetical protein